MHSYIIIMMTTLKRNLPLDISNLTIEEVKRIAIIVKKISITSEGLSPLLAYLEQWQIRIR